MAFDKSFTLQENFAATIKAGISAAASRNWDELLVRDPRLLVPVDVQAMVVRATEGVTHADVSGKGLLYYLRKKGQQLDAADESSEDDEESAEPAAFTDLENRPAGVYLHWAMPDGLTQGSVDADQETGEVTGDCIEMNPLPNRWLVVRAEQGRPRKLKSWVVESERGRVVSLEQWSEVAETTEGLTPEFTAEQLTAVCGGGITWSATFDSVENRFAFFDDVSDVANTQQPLTYFVTGWYSKPGLDPLNQATTENAFNRVREKLGWEVSNEDLQAAKKAAHQRHRKASKMGYKSSSFIKNLLQSNRSTGLNLATLLPRFVKQNPVATQTVEAWWPQQSQFHGVIYGVRIAENNLGDQRPSAESVDFSVGQTGTESLAVLISEKQTASNAAEIERLHTAFQYGAIDTIEEDDAIPRLEEEMHRRGFESQSGGFIIEKIRAGDAFGDLRPKPSIDWKNDYAYPAQEVVGVASVMESIRNTNTGIDESLILEPAEERVKSAQKKNATVELIREDMQVMAAQNVSFEFSAATLTEIISVNEWKNTLLERAGTEALLGAEVGGRQKRSFQNVRRALPRYFFPQEPVMSFQGLNRSLRHGYDGRFEPDETLACRISGTAISGYGGMLNGRDLLARRFQYGSLPPESEELIYEALLEDPQAEDDLAKIAYDKNAGKRNSLPEKNIKNRIAAEMALQRRLMTPNNKASALYSYSIKYSPQGVARESSPVGITYWRQAWVPLHVEWELELDLNESLSDWSLNELDYEFDADKSFENRKTLKGRSSLNSAGAKALAEELGEFLDEERKLDDVSEGVIDSDTQALLNNMARKVLYTDTLNTSFEGLRDFLLGFDDNLFIEDNMPESGGDNNAQEAPPVRAPMLLAGGRIRLSRLRIVDAFGRTLEMPQAKLAQINIAESMRGEEAGEMMMAPRIQRPSRLMFRFIDARDDKREVYIDQSPENQSGNPVAAWLLPDHVDRALEFFDARGNPLGQLRHSLGNSLSQQTADETVAEMVVWEGPPGSASPMGSSPNEMINNPHAAEFARSLVQRDAAERDAAAEDARQETPLNALLRVIDTTLWTVDPFGMGGFENYASLTGRPIAMVRARLKLEVLSDADDYPNMDETVRQQRKAAYVALSGKTFEVRLGALSRFEDGLLGYFIDNDYWRFYPVHSQVLKDALVAGRHKGFMGSESLTDEFANAPQTEPVTSPYVEADPTVELRPGQEVHLTLLMDPGSKVHATSGILPRKSIALSRDFIEDALSRISPSFRVGPVLVDPTTIRMPKVNGMPTEQQWTRRDKPGSWRDDPILAATQDALLPDESVLANEGYIRVKIDLDE